MKRFAMVLLAMVSGCMTMRKDAAAAYNEGDYQRSVDLYDKILAGEPGDREAQKHRDDARMAALRQLLFRAEDKRVAGKLEDAGGDLEQLLDFRDQWHVTLDPRMDAPLATELDEQSRYLVAQVIERAHKTGPLSAETLQHQHLIFRKPEFAAARTKVVAEIDAVAMAKCDSLPTDSPYLAWVTSSYCGHFGVQKPVATPPNLASGLQVDAQIANIDVAQTQAFASALTDAFAHSVWHAPKAAQIAHAALGGSVATAFSSKPVTLTKTYTVQVAYTESEQQYEPYEETYTDTESYQDPVTTYSTDADGNSTSSTSWETKTRDVTKTRTSYHWVTESVTKYRDEDRSVDYSAIQRDGSYAADLAVRIAGLPSALVTTEKQSFTRRGYDHDTTNEEAGLSPERANLMSPSAFISTETQTLRDKLLADLDGTYNAMYCAEAHYTPEQAAACAYFDPMRTPTDARHALSTIYGQDEPYLATLLKR